MVIKIPLDKAGDPHLNRGRRLKIQLGLGLGDIGIGGWDISGLNGQRPPNLLNPEVLGR